MNIGDKSNLFLYPAKKGKNIYRLGYFKTLENIKQENVQENIQLSFDNKEFDVLVKEYKNLEKRFEYKARIEFIDSLNSQLEKFGTDIEGLDPKERLKELKELEKLADDILTARTKSEIVRHLEEIQGKGKYLRKWATNCIQLFKGLADTTPEDIKNAESVNKFKKVKSKGTVFETGMKNIMEIMNNSELSDEEKLEKINKEMPTIKGNIRLK